MMVEKIIIKHLSVTCSMEILEMPKPFLFFGSMCSIYKDFAPNKVCSSEKIIIPRQQNVLSLQLCNYVLYKSVPSK